MKNLLLCLSFIFICSASYAQETEIASSENSNRETTTIIKSLATKSALATFLKKDIAIDIDKVCYGETSKVAFFEALISKNGFKINLKNSNDLAIKNTEEIISKKRDEILYSEED